ncbi:glycosyltransferase [Microbacterium betulae]|uniref:Glycosyltransferase n=1 Tax=Microbacterium betulae TaxID=2981139 RepID=A0AA97FH91_9MICO|nr:glycosyltransferase [Microbacterium sp. AB]WOF22265.1 glycosyltransferase [Microbacterium sp. AB]
MPRPLRRTVVLGMNYPPESTGISPYTGGLARGLARRGITTQVLTAHPHYPAWRIDEGYGQWKRAERSEGVEVLRLRHYVPARPRGLARLLSEVTFGIRLATTPWGSADAVVAVSPALFATWIATARARLTHRDAPFVVWVQDLYGQGMSQLEGDGLAARILRSAERRLLNGADHVVVIHDRFRARVRDDLGVDDSRISVVRNWSHVDRTPPTDPTGTRALLGWGPHERIVLHAGNMGLKQGLDNVVAAARAAHERGSAVRFVLLGDGSERERLHREAAELPSLTFTPALGDDLFLAALGAADVLLVNERPGVTDMAVPSKLTSYFAAGRPVLAATDAHSITADEVRAAGAGVVVPADEPIALLDAALALCHDAPAALRLGASGRRYCETVLDAEHAVDRFAELLSDVVRRSRAEGHRQRTVA